MASPTRLWRLLFLLLQLAGGAMRPADDAGDAERMYAELDAAGGAVASSDLTSFADAAGLAPELADALTDIMAVLQQGSDLSREDAVAHLIQLSVETAETGREQATMFRSAVVAGGALPELVAMLGEADPGRQALAAAAVHALAVDDPTTDDDYFHSLAICEAGAVAPLVGLLSVNAEDVQVCTWVRWARWRVRRLLSVGSGQEHASLSGWGWGLRVWRVAAWRIELGEEAKAGKVLLLPHRNSPPP
jgi:hypothetical protein